MVNFWSIIAQLVGERCAICGTSTCGICAACQSELPRNSHVCRRCAAPLPADVTPELPCARCQQHAPAFSATIAALEYRSPTDRLIASFKYRHGLHLAAPLAGCLVETLTRQRRRSDAWPQQIVPVPMPPERLRHRGFNQATELARIVGTALSIPVNNRLVSRPSATTTQRGLTRAARGANVRDAFVVRQRAAEHIAVVDDVMTTGATAESISLALSAAGASTVEIWVVARTPQAPAANKRGKALRANAGQRSASTRSFISRRS